MKNKNDIIRSESSTLAVKPLPLIISPVIPAGSRPGSSSFQMFRRFHQGFTLIELLVVVLIIGILAAVAVPQYQKAVLKSRYVQLMVSLQPIEQAIKSYQLANNKYPTRFDELDISLPGEQITDYAIKNGSYSCMLYDITRDGMNSSIYCKYSSGDNMIAYRWVFDQSRRQCEATKTWSLGVKVCQDVCGNAENSFLATDWRHACFID